MTAIYPPIGLHFRVEFELKGLKPGDNDSRFQEVSGLEAQLGSKQIVEGGENRFTHRLPERPSYSNLILKRGMLSNSKLIDWFRDAVENFIFNPVNVSVVLLNEESLPISSWVFVDAYPVKWSISNFNAKEGEIVIDTIELSYKYMRRIDGYAN